MRIRIGSRGSPLAKTQTSEVKKLLEGKFPEIQTELVFIKTSGDSQENWISDSGGKGVFVKEIEEALLCGSIDIAVHSMKDLPSVLPDGLIVGCVPQRNDPSDCIVFPETQKGACLESLKKGAKIGTGSLRRSFQILAMRPDVSVEPVRGNIGTRIAKMDSGHFDAIILACAALGRLKIENRNMQKFNPADFVPAPGQGALALECREKDTETIDLMKEIECAQSRRCAEIERSFLHRLGGNCRIPAGCYARENENGTEIFALMASVEDGQIYREKIETREKCRARNGAEIAEKIMSKARPGN